jgi:hypothetical protein
LFVRFVCCISRQKGVGAGRLKLTFRHGGI